jgi:acyl-CoA thioesterase II
MPSIESLLAVLRLQAVSDGRFRGDSLPDGPVIFGGQLLAQTIVAASAAEPDKRVKTVHTVFARAGSPEASLELTVEPLHQGRAMASSTVTFWQRERGIARSQVLMCAEEPDCIRHADGAPVASAPDDPRARQVDQESWEVRYVDGVDIRNPDQVLPPELRVWTRFAGAPEDPIISQALLAYATDGFLIGTAMLPHAGVGQSQAHVTLSTGVLSHTLTFHEPCSASGWMLLAHHSIYAGHGGSYGQGNVFDEDGMLVASFIQDAMIRAMPEKSKL